MNNIIKRAICYYRYSDKDIMSFLKRFFYSLSKRTGFNKKLFAQIWHQCLVDKYSKRLKSHNGILFLDFNGAKLPNILDDAEKTRLLDDVFLDIFYISCFCNDHYDKFLVEKLDKYFLEGPYCYQEKNGVNVMVEADDIVIDAGAWIGDFSAYAASKGACVYAFEPVNETYNYLCKTAELNERRIIPINKGLGENEATLKISINESNSGANTLLKKGSGDDELVEIISLDKFVEDNNLNKIDFIKSDIEGFERYLLKGAKKTLAKYSPKLSICTYHYLEDPQLLEKLILDANPNYTIVHLRHKLVASVI